MGDPTQHIMRSLDLADAMLKLAGEGMADSTDDGCLALFGLVLDSSYRIRLEAEKEREVHRRCGRWTENADRSMKKEKR